MWATQYGDSILIATMSAFPPAFALRLRCKRTTFIYSRTLQEPMNSFTQSATGRLSFVTFCWALEATRQLRSLAESTSSAGAHRQLDEAGRRRIIVRVYIGRPLLLIILTRTPIAATPINVNPYLYIIIYTGITRTRICYDEYIIPVTNTRTRTGYYYG